MSAGTKSDLRLEIAHVLFIDIVGYSKLLINEQHESLQELNQIVRGTEAFRTAETAGQLTRVPTGDGMALVFSTTPDAPVQCALEIGKALKSCPDLRVRMGIHSGPVSAVTDVNDRSNIAGGGINMAQRVMDCGDAGHILLSKRVAEDLVQYRQWQPHLHDLGECQVKHDVTVSLVNLYTDEARNAAIPTKFAAAQRETAASARVVPRSATRETNSLFIAGVIFILLIASAGFWLFSHQTSTKSTTVASTSTAPSVSVAPVISEKTIAVLPFENLSSDKENAFFAQGIQDEIITTLSKISGLRVHINVQLIQADTDAHLWAQSYDRQLIDIFAVEAEVAKQIADALSATLSPQEKARVETKPTANADAYVLYLRGRDYQTRPDNFLQDFQSASNFYEQAIALDPNFALAHARLSVVTSQIYHWFEPTEAVKHKARSEADESLRLQPDLGEGHLALGVYFYYEESQYEQALRELNLAANALPNDGDVRLFIAAVQRRQGHFTEPIATYQRAEAIDPRNQVTLYDASQTYFGLRDWTAALRGLDRVLELVPDSVNVKIQRGYTEFFAKGSTASIKAALESIPANVDPDGVVTFARWDVSLMDRDPAAAEKALAGCRLETITSQPGAPLPKTYLQGCIDLARNDTPRAQTDFEAARPALEKTVADSPQDSTRHAQLGFFTHSWEGKKMLFAKAGARSS
jgi:TolB-like protein/class 3 adenylate cyclase